MFIFTLTYKRFNMRTEKTLTGIFLAGVALKMFNIPGYSILLILSLLIISLLYFPFAFYFFSDKSLKTQNIFLSIFGGMILAIIPIGVLFKLMFWPGADISLIGGITLTAIFLILTYFMYKKSSTDLNTYYKNYLTRILFWLVISIIFYSISKKQLLQIQHSNDPKLLELKINAYENPDNMEYQYELENYCRQQDSLYLVNEMKNN